MKKIILPLLLASFSICAWSEANPDQEADALVVCQGTTIDDCYLLEGGVTFVFDNEAGTVSVGETTYTLAQDDVLTAYPDHTFPLTANQDPDQTDNYYATFYTGHSAYRLPQDVKAYVTSEWEADGADVHTLVMTSVGSIIPKGEAVIIKATPYDASNEKYATDILLLPSASQAAATSGNWLAGSDEQTTAPAGSYFLTLGQYGVGFYMQSSTFAVPANKAYLTPQISANAFTFRFDDGTDTRIKAITANDDEGEPRYSVYGMRVDDSYKGIIIQNGKKILQ